MSIFTLNWFKSSHKKELEKLKIEKQKLKNEILKSQLNADEKDPKPEMGKPYLKLKMVNDVLTVVMHNGEILTKIPATKDDFEKIYSCTNQDQLLSAFMIKADDKLAERIEQEEIMKVTNSMHVIEKVKGFELRDDSVYLKGINRSIPKLLVENFIKIVNSFMENGEVKKELYENVEFVSLKRFFMWCCLNPRAEVAEKLYDFLMKNSFRITKQGFFVALRNVVSLEAQHGNNDKVHFISNTYNKVKGVWKKNPEHFDVYEHEGIFKLVDLKKSGNKSYSTRLGNLKDLYIDLPNMTENRFTDDWTKTFDIRIGNIVNMPMEECNWSTQDCAASGLHFTSNEIHYVGCGDTSVLMLINPMKVVGIGEKKGRCYEYLPIMTVPRDEATQILHDLDFDTIDLDEFYVETQLESLSEKAMQAFAEETKKHQFNLSGISSSEINKIIKNLNKIKDDLRKRVQEVV